MLKIAGSVFLGVYMNSCVKIANSVFLVVFSNSYVENSRPSFPGGVHENLY